MAGVHPSHDREHATACVVHTSLRGLFGAAVTPVVLVALGIAAMASTGTVRVVPVVLVASGSVLAMIVALDYPRYTRFDHDGLWRVCFLRTHHVPWSRITAIERTPRRTLSRVRQLTSRDPEPHVSGGLVARGRGRSRWLLTDRVESAAEHDRVRHLLSELDLLATLRASRPPEGTPPTDLYRPHRRR